MQGLLKFKSLILLASLGLCLVITLANCKPRSDSTLQHDADKVLRGSGRWQWINISEQDFARDLLPSLELASADLVVPKSDPMHARMAMWLQAFHELLVEKHPELTKQVPEPQVVIVKDPEPNAYVTSAALCVHMPLRLNSELPVTSASTLARVALSTYGMIEPSEAEAACLERPMDKATIQEAIKWFNNNNPSCELKWQTDPSGKDFLLAERSCPLSPALEEVTWANDFSFESTTNWIVVHTGLLQLFDDEEKMLSIVAHELGHYYRSHHTVFEKEYNYFYQQAGHTHASKPKPEKTLAPLGKKVFQGSKLIQQALVAKQKMPSAFFKPSIDLAASYCRKRTTACPDACRRASELAKTDEFEAAFAKFPDEDLATDNLGLYTKMETALLACAPQLKIAKLADKTHLSLRNLTFALQRHDLDALFGGDERIASLQDALQQWTSSYKAVSEQAKLALAQAERDQLGYYTIEQEADEFGLEMMVNAGFNPEKVVQAAIDFYVEDSDADEPAHISGISKAKCIQLRAAGWKSAPPIADFYDDHHSGCYRVYNLDREMTLHGYKQIKRERTPALADVVAWKEFRKCATTASAEAPQSEFINEAPGLSARRSLNARGCKISGW